MIRRFIDAVATVLAGIAIGWLLAPGGQSDPRLRAERSPSATTPSMPVASVQAGDTSTESVNDNCADETSSPVQTALSTPEPIPEVYLDMIGYPEDGTSTPDRYDRYLAFARDVRDESWAAAMEAGIANFAARLNQMEVVVEYIECRTLYCVIAGHSPTGSQGQLGDMRDTGWWQAAGVGADIVQSGRDGQDDFVLFVERYANGN